MTPPERARPERNAGAFLGPDFLAPVPMRTLSDEIRDEPAEPEEEHEPAPEPPGVVRRLIDRLPRRGGQGR